MMRKATTLALATALILATVNGLAAPPDTMSIQGTLADAVGEPLTGARVWRVQFFDAQTTGTALGVPSTGTATVTASGRFSIAFTPSAEVITAPNAVWYELAIDSAATPDGIIDAGDTFANRVQAHSVLFARRASLASAANHAVTADRSTTAAYADSTSTASNALAIGGIPGDDLATDIELTSGLVTKADAAHNHNSAYAAITHNHDGVYALIGHGHSLEMLDGVVTDDQVPDEITIDHAATADSSTTATHSDSSTTSTYADHSERVKQTVRDFVVASGYSVNVGDVVAFLSGEVAPFEHSGGESVFSASGANYISAAALSSSKFVITYRDYGGGGQGTAIVGEISGTALSWGNESVFNAIETYFESTAALSPDRFVVAYKDGGSYGGGAARVGEVSGVSISWGSESAFTTQGAFYISATALSASKFVVAYHDYTGTIPNYGKAIVGTVSGTDLSWGTESAFRTEVTHDISAVALPSGKFVVAYSKGNPGQGAARVGEVSGTILSWGTESGLGPGVATFISAAALPSGKFVVAYRSELDSDYGAARVGEVSGADISWGGKSIFRAASTDYISAVALPSGKFVVAYHSAGQGRAIVGEPFGTSIAWGSESVFRAAAVGFISTAQSSSKLLVAYGDGGNSYYGTATILASFDSPLGIAGDTATSGQSVPVILDGVSDVHSGLTPWETYFAGDAGALTADGDSLDYPKVGRALSPTELLLKID